MAHDIVQIKREALKLIFMLGHIQLQAVFLGFVKDGEVKREQSLGIINGNVKPGFPYQLECGNLSSIRQFPKDLENAFEIGRKLLKQED